MNVRGYTTWSNLRAVLDGYLHQDFVAEHGSAAAAIRAWLVDARGENATAVSSEWRSFLNVTAGTDAETRARALREAAGGAWAPANAAEFEEVSVLLRDAWRR